MNRRRIEISLLTGLLATGSTACAAAGHGTRVARADCDPVEYDARGLRARVEVPNRVGVELETSRQALREIDTWSEQYFAAWKTACMDYKNGAMTREEYNDEARRIRARMESVQKLSSDLQATSDPKQFDAVLRAGWQAHAPEGERLDLQLRVKVMAKRPGEAEFSVAPQGATLPSGTRIFTLVSLNAAANVTMYQLDDGAPTVLFPQPAHGQDNPVAGGTDVRIPASGYFALDDEDLGIEQLYITAQAAGAAAPESLAVGQGCGQRGLTFEPDACPRTRGLQFVADGTDFSVGAANAAGDAGVQVVYSFHHAGDPKLYGSKCPPGVDDCRGPEALRGVISSRPAKMPGNFDACPGDAVHKEMAGPQGAYERWCVDETPSGHLVDDGPYRKWRGSGQLWVHGQFQRGAKVGTWTTYDAQGQALATVDYD